MSAEVSIETRRRRAIYRATHRGTKEMDWVIGRFAESEVPAMTERDLSRFEQFLTLPDPDLQRSIMDDTAGIASEFQSLVASLRRYHGLSDPPSGERP